MRTERAGRNGCPRRAEKPSRGAGLFGRRSPGKNRTVSARRKSEQCRGSGLSVATREPRVEPRPRTRRHARPPRAPGLGLLAGAEPSRESAGRERPRNIHARESRCWPPLTFRGVLVSDRGMVTTAHNALRGSNGREASSRTTPVPAGVRALQQRAACGQAGRAAMHRLPCRLPGVARRSDHVSRRRHAVRSCIEMERNVPPSWWAR